MRKRIYDQGSRGMLNMKVRFDIITPDNWRVFNAMKVKKEQAGFVASNLTILARAFAFRDYNSHVYAILMRIYQ